MFPKLLTVSKKELPQAVVEESTPSSLSILEQPTGQERDCFLTFCRITTDFIIVLKRDGRIVYINRAAREALGLGRPQGLGERHIRDHHRLHDYSRLINQVVPAVANNGVWSGEDTLVSRSGREIPVSLVMTASRARDPNLSLLCYFARDISKHKQREVRLRHRADHDPVTGLPNRTCVDDRLRQAIRNARRHEHLVGLLFLDIDDFKQINDSIGHSAADKLLVTLARRLEDCLRDVDTVGRYGGDEFVVVLSELHSRRDASIVLEKIAAAFSEPHLNESGGFNLTCSIGIAIYPHDAQDGAELLARADTAMYRVKACGKNGHHYIGLGGEPVVRVPQAAAD